MHRLEECWIPYRHKHSFVGVNCPNGKHSQRWNILFHGLVDIPRKNEKDFGQRYSIILLLPPQFSSDSQVWKSHRSQQLLGIKMTPVIGENAGKYIFWKLDPVITLCSWVVSKQRYFSPQFNRIVLTKIPVHNYCGSRKYSCW